MIDLNCIVGNSVQGILVGGSHELYSLESVEEDLVGDLPV